jgi:tetratricopeptide (TPR) repeat protein
MKSPLSAALLVASLALGCGQALAQGAGSSSAEARRQTANNTQLFYQVLLGEMSAASGDTGAAISLLLDAARKTQDEALFQRATDLALGARAGETALQVVRSWRQTLPKSLAAARYQLQILTAINRVSDSAEALRAVIDLTAPAERNQVLALIPALYARASDKKLAATVIEQSLAAALADAQTSASAWTAVGRARLASGDSAGALEAVQRALAVDARSRSALGLALDLMAPGRTQAEALVRGYLDAPGLAEAQVRIDYARHLLEQQRYAEGAAQLRRLTTEHPQLPEAWLMLGSLQMDQPQTSAAEASLKRYLDLTESTDADQAARARRGRGQAYLMLAQMAERRGDLAGASRWLDQIEDRDLMVQTQARRASLLARRGQLAEGRMLLQKLPEQNPQDARRKLLAEVNLLREFKDHRSAYELMQKAVTAAPQDHELIYEKSLLAEKLGRIEEMEQLLRRVMQVKPDYHAAYNALGYSLADRGLRLQEARQLIKKALQLAPDDPYIQDSLAWVEFRLGNAQEALRVIEIAYTAKPDAEIAAHFGEILWSLGQRDRARMIWREGLMLNAENDTLQETLKRLQVTP